MFSYRFFQSGSDKILAICDKSLLGKTLTQGEMNFTVSEKFYSGNTCGKEGVKNLISSATIINAIGSEIIKILVEEKVVNEKNLIKINNIPHAQVISI